jgi:hypothetical protein
MAKTRRSGGDVGPEWRYKKKRDKIISIVMTEEQQNAIKKAAHAANQSASTWLLERALESLPTSEAKKEW